MSGFSGKFQMAGGLALRFPVPSDDTFLLDMFMASRPWFNWVDQDRDQIRALYESQYAIVRTGVGNVYPEHLDFVIERSGQAVGRLTINLGYADWRISLIELHPLVRRKSVGSDVFRSLQAAATANAIPLTVSTPSMLTEAVRFYAKLGFMLIGEQPPMLHLIWYPPSMRPAVPAT